MRVFAVRYKNDEIRAKSQSGGAFMVLTEQFLKDGVIYGCALDENLEATHIRVTNSADRSNLRRSKYVQSHIGDCYKQIKIDLLSGKKVAFSGTSCQVAGLKNFLQHEYDNLLCIDIICHGVPSPAVWKKYVQWREQTTGRKIKEAQFRNKNKFGWRRHVETLIFEDGHQIDSMVYVNMTFIHNILRPSCYECPYKSIHFPGDMTIGDYWGIEKAAPELDDNKGTSIVLVNNEKGQMCLNNAINDDVICKETRIEDSIQPPFLGPFNDRTYEIKFWNDFATRDFSYIAKKYGGAGFKNDMKRFLGKVKRKIKRLVKG